MIFGHVLAVLRVVGPLPPVFFQLIRVQTRVGEVDNSVCRVGAAVMYSPGRNAGATPCLPATTAV
jgi:hypothetical protein